jgi:hypothetical protein
VKKRINEIFENVLNSLNTKSNGYSARKLTALSTIVMVWVIHVKWLRSQRWEYIGEILLMDLTFILALLGLTTWQKLKQNEKPDINNPDSAN